jgi:hypothetical protein
VIKPIFAIHETHQSQCRPSKSRVPEKATMLIGALALFTVLGCIMPPKVWADLYQYTYTGNVFTDLQGSDFNTSEFVVGDFTYSGVLPDSSTFYLNPLTFSFSAGPLTITSSLYDVHDTFQITTDAAGAIVGWTIDINDTNVPVDYIETVGTTNFFGTATVGGDDIASLDNTFGENSNVPGTWTVSGLPAPTASPEPASLALLSVGLFGLRVVRRRRGKGNPIHHPPELLRLGV